MSEPTPSQAEGERDDQEGIDQTRGLSARRAGRKREESGGAAAPPPSQAEGGRTGEEGTEQDRGGGR
ncbi:MAG TPA: hypothetical protein VFY14_02020 [Streptomyces sp.]|nr:hypothetical protein [Streptomyces sp.]